MGYFDNWNWESIIGDAAKVLPQAIAAGYGANQVARANQKAANMAQQNRAANTAAIQAGNQRASEMLQPVAGQQAPALDYMRTVMARSPYELNPQQIIELADRRRQALQMAPASLRGSGRGMSAISNDVANRGRAGMIAQNQQRSDAASNFLANQGGAATNAMANIQAGQGPQIAGQNTAATQAGMDATTGTAGSNAQTLGNIASFFANAQKDREYESRYRDMRDRLGPGSVVVMGR